MSVYTWRHDPAQGWRDDADCRDLDPTAWDLDVATDEQLAFAKGVCDDCPVRVACLADAFTNEERATLRGGVNFGDGADRLDIPRARPQSKETTVLAEQRRETCPHCGRAILIAKGGTRLRHTMKAQRASSANRREPGQWCPGSREQVYS
jgi:WhiB family redox-sensing transcriptional regulator